ncbi:MAG: NusG domain II-containing protein [Lachnospiraceae bacterium]|nr:NusG domain II-containing protein [Lachnospiraceae bacterium]
MVKKGDRIMIGGALLIVLVSFIVIRLMAVSGTKVIITQNGEVYGTYDLHQNQVIQVEADGGTNTVKIRDGSVSMTEASCPDQICVHTYPLSEGEPGAIVCLPHELIVEIKQFGK